MAAGSGTGINGSQFGGRSFPGSVPFCCHNIVAELRVTVPAYPVPESKPPEQIVPLNSLGPRRYSVCTAKTTSITMTMTTSEPAWPLEAT